MPNAVPLTTELLVDGVWTAYPLYSAEGWSTQVGPDVEAGLQAGRLEVVLANDNLQMDPSNVSSPLYGKIGRNTPARMLIGGSVICAGEASSWKPERTVEHQPGAAKGRSHTALVAEGLLRRIGRWEDPLRSPMSRQIASYASLLGYWRLEDPSTAATLANETTGGRAGSFSGSVTLDGDPGAGGADGAVKLGADGVIGGQFLAFSASGWQICWAGKLPAVPASGTYIAMFQWSDTTGRTWYWRVNSGSFEIAIYDSAGALITSTTSTFGAGVNVAAWTRYRLKCTVSGSTVTYEPAWYPQDGSTSYGVTATFAGTSTGQPVGWAAVSNAYTNGAAFGHVFATSDLSLDLLADPAAVRAFDGYLGELAAARFTRLLTESGFQSTVVGDPSKSAPMGRQRAAKLIELLEEIQRTEGGLIYDSTTQVQLVFRVFNYLVNAATAMTLTYGVNVAPPLTKNIDDVGAINDITGKNWDGTEVRRELTTGGLSVQPPPAGAGRYKGNLDVSFSAAARLADRVNWALRDATVDRPRYQQVTVDLLANPGLRATTYAMRPGDLISLVGVEPDPVPLRVLTITRRGGAVAESVTFSCRPGDVWTPGKWSDGVRRWDSGSTTLGAGVTAAATTLTFTTAAKGDLWSQTSAYDVLIAGERIGIPAGGMSAASGTGPYTQTATGVTRSKNGVVKAQTAGAPIRVATPGRWAR